MLTLEKKYLKLQYDNQVYELDYPTLESVVEFQKQPEEKRLEATVDLLDKLGLPKKITLSMEIDNVTKVLNELTSKKK